jgi:hypothetical protein
VITLSVSDNDIQFAKEQIKRFTAIPQGQWRYDGVEAWRGIVCEMLTSDWLEQNFKVQERAKGLDTTGIPDDYDLIISNKKVEIKSATKNYFKYVMPKIHDVINKPKDVYVAAKYNETSHPHKVIVVGYMRHKDIFNYPIEQDKGAPYYKVPLKDFSPFRISV